jgi:hypothetical protein
MAINVDGDSAYDKSFLSRLDLGAPRQQTGDEYKGLIRP